MRIPVFFAAVNDRANYQVMVDGGVTRNYPIDVLDGPDADPSPENKV